MPPKKQKKQKASAPRVIITPRGEAIDMRLIDRINDPNYRDPLYPRDDTDASFEDVALRSLAPAFLRNLHTGTTSATDFEVTPDQRGDLFTGDVFPANPLEQMRTGRQSSIMRKREREASPDRDLDLSAFD